MVEYKLKQKEFTPWKTVTGMLGYFLIVCALVILFAYRFGELSSGLQSLIPVFLLCLYTTIRSILADQKESRKRPDSYTLILTDSSITRKQPPLPDFTLPFSDISEIAKLRNGKIRIQGQHRDDVIFVFPNTEFVEELEERLRDVKDFKRFTPVSYLQSRWLDILTIAAVVGFVLFENKILISVCAVFLSGIMIWYLVIFQRSKRLDPGTKRKAWLILIPMFFVLLTMIMRLTA